ncbi:hypothetical protein IWW57_002468 [Coemansia sp. S610]|nr:hypothetical protein IWW57_002468 [Coemansia sp. S610]
MNNSLDAIEASHYWSATANDIIENGGQHHTKYAHLRIPYSAILTGALAGLLSLDPYREAVFPQVECIQVNLAKGGALDGLNDEECMENVHGFVARVRSMFPNATMCSVSNTMVCLPEEETATKHYSQLVTELAQNTRQIKYYTSNEVFSIGTLANLGGLTHLVYSECSSSSTLLYLVLGNASTLQVLNLDIDNPEQVSQFVHTDAGTQVTYPNLHTLKSVCASDTVVEQRSAPLHTPFPELRNLTMTHSYPFTNDAMFRGNHLGQLGLNLDIIDLLILDKSGVLEKNRFAQVTDLDLEINLIDQPYGTGFGQRLCRMLLEMAPNIERLRLRFMGIPLKSSLQNSFTAVPPLDKLRFVTITGVALSLAETVGLVGRIPKLSQLMIEPQTTDYEDEDYEAEGALRAEEIRRVEELRQAKTLSRSALRNVIFHNPSYADMNGASHFACQLAILCPRLTCIRWGYHSSAFDSCCRDNAADTLYSAYKKRLESVEWTKVK